LGLRGRRSDPPLREAEDDGRNEGKENRLIRLRDAIEGPIRIGIRLLAGAPDGIATKEFREQEVKRWAAAPEQVDDDHISRSKHKKLAAPPSLSRQLAATELGVSLAVSLPYCSTLLVV